MLPEHVYCQSTSITWIQGEGTSKKAFRLRWYVNKPITKLEAILSLFCCIGCFGGAIFDSFLVDPYCYVCTTVILMIKQHTLL